MSACPVLEPGALGPEYDEDRPGLWHSVGRILNVEAHDINFGMKITKKREVLIFVRQTCLEV